MARLRFSFRPPGGLRPVAAGVLFAATGPALAASSGVETLDAAVARELGAIRAVAAEDPSATDPSDGAPRRLPEMSDPSLRPVSGQTTTPPRPEPTPAQLEVMRQLEEMYKRDGRGPMPSLRIKDAPNTRLPNGQLPAPPRGKTPSGIQPASAPAALDPDGLPPAPAPAVTPQQPSRKPKNRFLSLFSRKSSTAEARRPSLLDRFRGRTAAKPSMTAKGDSGGLFGKMLSPFRREEKREVAVPETPPAPPPLPDYGSPSDYAAQPQPLHPAPARPLAPSQSFPPAAPPIVAGPSDFPPTARTAERDPNPFLEENGFKEIEINPAPVHPLDDEFAAVRDLAAPDVSVADIDPEFADAPPSFDDEAPRTLEPETVASDDDAFGPVRLETPPAEPPAARPQQSPAARYAELQRKLAERAGLGGFQGFCPVALRDRRELVDSRPEFLSVHEGRTYELSSAEAKARFDADPAKYAPVNRGNDVVLTARGETEAEGCLNYAVWFKDRLYLFRSPATLAEFNAEPTKYAVAE